MFLINYGDVNGKMVATACITHQALVGLDIFSDIILSRGVLKESVMQLSF